MTDWSPFLAAALAAAPVPAAERPVRLEVDEVGQGVRLRVVGLADRPLRVSYTLELASDPSGGGNRSTQRGSTRLEPGRAVTLSTTTLGAVAPGRWSAKLSVEPEGAPAYDVVRASE